MLQSWADAAGGYMSSSAKNLAIRVPAESIKSQQAAVDELDKIWDAIIPFQPLLVKELAEQTAIANTLKPNSDEPAKDETSDTESDTLTVVPKESKAQESNSDDAELEKDSNASERSLQIADDQLPQLTKDQERALRKTRMLAPKAEMELQQLDAAPAPEQQVEPERQGNAGATEQQPGTPKQVDPEQVKAGLRKAIELAPKAVSEMESALESLNQKELNKAWVAAEEARSILEEILQAQPKNEQQQQDEQQQDQNKDQQQDQQKQNEDQKDRSKDNKSNDKKDDKQDEQKKDEQKKDADKQNKDEKQSDEKKSPQEQSQTKQQVSQERMAEALRKVRERQKEKQERDREIRAQILGRAPVDKDW